MPQIKHVVLMKFKPSTASQKIREVFTELAGLRGKVAGLMDFTGGPYSSTEGLNQGFTHGFVMTFADVASRDAYIPHPEHDHVKELILPELEGGVNGIIAFDWQHKPA